MKELKLIIYLFGIILLVGIYLNLPNYLVPYSDYIIILIGVFVVSFLYWAVEN